MGILSDIVNEAKVEMCPEACCGKPVTECKCGPDCEHCDCHSKNKAMNESYSPGDENEDGMVSNCCGAPVMDVYDGHGRCSDCKEMASAEKEEEYYEDSEIQRLKDLIKY